MLINLFLLIMKTLKEQYEGFTEQQLFDDIIITSMTYYNDFVLGDPDIELNIMKKVFGDKMRKAGVEWYQEKVLE